MIEFDEAKALIAEEALKLLIQKKSVAHSLGFVLAKDIMAPIDLPPFDSSAVDGFALHLSDSMSLPINGHIRAKPQERAFLLPGQAIEIMTGTPTPLRTEAVIMKEEVIIKEGRLKLKRRPQKNENIRFLGEDIKKNALVAKAGEKVRPKTIGLLLALGLHEVEVFRPPRIKIIATGDELVDAPTPLKFGQVYHLMGPMLKAQCQSIGINEVEYSRVDDNKDAIAFSIARSLDSDILLLAGGISAGDHDLVKPALLHLGVKEIFHRGAWRPGKPLFFGRSGDVRIFGLPGNPVSAFTCFHLFVRYLIAISLGQDYEPFKAILMNDYSKKSQVTVFAQANVKDGMLNIREDQGSHRIFGLSKANALCVLPSAHAIVKAQSLVQYYPI